MFGRPCFKINNQTNSINEVLLDISYDKQYLTESQPRPQSSQKGPNCWYYCFNFLRPRYGKAFSEEFLPRGYEKKISAYRKKISRLYIEETQHEQILKRFSARPISKDVVRSKQKEQQSNIFSKHYSAEEKQLLQKFLLQNEEQCFEKYLKKMCKLQAIRISKETLLSLNIDPEVALKQFYEEKQLTVDKTDLNNTEKTYAALIRDSKNTLQYNHFCMAST